MRLALLCDDPGVIPWLDALSVDSPDELVLAVTLTPAMSDMLRGRSGIRLTNHWEDLLSAREVDAILVGGSDQQLLDPIKQYASAGQPLLFLPSADCGSTFIYELSLIRDDNHVTICPAFWHRYDPALMRIRGRIATGSLGAMRLVQFERVFPEVPSGLISHIALDRIQLYDFDLLRWLIGDYNQLTAMHTGATLDGVLTQSVKLAGRGLTEATWNASAGTVESCCVIIHSEQGRTQLEFDFVTNTWTLIESNGDRIAGSRQTAIRELLNRFAKTLPSPESPATANNPVEWQELVKAFETVDATHRSIARRRTIELHFEPMSEQAIFKTQMTAMGCGVLIGTFLLSLAYLAVASTVPLPTNFLLILRTLVFAPLAIFLFLQMLYPLARPSSAESNGENQK